MIIALLSFDAAIRFGRPPYRAASTPQPRIAQLLRI